MYTVFAISNSFWSVSLLSINMVTLVFVEALSDLEHVISYNAGASSIYARIQIFLYVKLERMVEIIFLRRGFLSLPQLKACHCQTRLGLFCWIVANDFTFIFIFTTCFKVCSGGFK